jgi:hypothetical protein
MLNTWIGKFHSVTGKGGSGASFLFIYYSFVQTSHIIFLKKDANFQSFESPFIHKMFDVLMHMYIVYAAQVMEPQNTNKYS